MCTSISFLTKEHYFGRTLDNDFSFGEKVTITPRNYSFTFLNGRKLSSHYAIIGMAYVCENYPLYYDAMNEKGLCMAGLNFVGNAAYRELSRNKDNVAVFEFIPWILSQCATVAEARERIGRINLTGDAFSAQLPPASLHWIIADREEAITVESTKAGIHIYDNPVGALTNNPPFDQQMFRLNDYMHLSRKDPQNRFPKELGLSCYSRGMGALGLPGDLSSQSRFVRVAFVKLNSVSGDSEAESVSQFFHIMDTVKQVRGCCDLCEGRYEITQYTSCCNADKGIYYYTTYQNRGISAVDMHSENLDSEALICYPLDFEQQINFQNKKA